MKQEVEPLSQRVLVDGLDHRSSPQSEEELLAHLIRIDTAARQRAEPLIATVYANADDEDSSYLSIGLGSEDSVLVFASNRRSGAGGYSKGPRIGDTTEIHFRYGTDFGFFEAWMLIPKDLALVAATEFFRTGRQPSSVQWEEL